ncbi:DUF948 domain-containing protein [Paenibacillus mucilaginosus]|uniref:DUF948 domain-containing protein n=3 Tax=Paenibacillus mucilaginosus TaxID=61624 RepID=H6NPT5_9BACL|nr:DUF948 domain-containing protein [Paenibacillus mucilaginosus]AEI45787.1 hypothetical protein KNP414_07277 [Paenibacillus mucilaginosus KNP414]AFC33441.1 hypothetical protein PM3016_6841 [Paenibacillus mucilaginosus 3016]AFH65761.1 hypothetical protein B2K_34530 [Paenibacillus mucilaginosus K02]MCG7215029.1 DUF948 domain-containing protein [Paenibacillus mucilaginosus]WDM27162.1 DUF948 domain-containing protein [Paenibacillus mucilaginosus]
MENSWIIEASVAVAAIAFVALVVFLIMTLRSVSALLGQTNGIMREIQQQVSGLSAEATEVLRHTNEVTVDVRNKLHSIDSVVYSVKNVGDAVEEITSSLKQASATVAGTVRSKVVETAKQAEGPTEDKVVKVMQAVPVVIDLWNSFRNRKSMKSSTLSKA